MFLALGTSMIGARLGKWLIDKKLGSGGMGDVFLAHELSNDSPETAHGERLAAHLNALPARRAARRGRAAPRPIGDAGRKRHGVVGAGTALPADVNQELLGLGLFNGDVLDEQPQHSLAVLGVGGASMP